MSEIAEDSDPRAGENWRRDIERRNVMAIESEQLSQIRRERDQTDKSQRPRSFPRATVCNCTVVRMRQGDILT